MKEIFSIKFSIMGSKIRVLVLVTVCPLILLSQKDLHYSFLEKKTYKINSLVFKDATYNLNNIVANDFKLYFYKAKKWNELQSVGRVKLTVGKRKQTSFYCSNKGIVFYYPTDKDSLVTTNWGNSYDGCMLKGTQFDKIFYLVFNSKISIREQGQDVIIQCPSEKITLNLLLIK